MRSPNVVLGSAANSSGKLCDIVDRRDPLVDVVMDCLSSQPDLDGSVRKGPQCNVPFRIPLNEYRRLADELLPRSSIAMEFR